ncbi:hypothetical protein K2173_023908 [Erythroxylum novogranatense]|uniref:Glutamine amidotransferase domain-containing protein n=1 Tax=Erythroxylum novogranatense TaxID=1862640 RepID=A0AAV8TQB1_9ROSI|nr:hypothetical protein K2173_023908 [Erythroxylum novogranatense]
MDPKRYAVLLCLEDTEYVKKKYGGDFGLFVGMLSEAGERWEVYRVACGEFPADDVLESYDGFVITGSCNDAHGNDLWICKLIILLKKLDSMQKKILGICFGHQVLGRALGGTTGRAISGLDIGVTTIHFTPPKMFSSLNIPTSISVIECHQDEIRQLPPRAVVMAWSEKTGIEMFKCGDHIMGIQGHPEYNKDILLHLIGRLSERKLIVESFAEEVKASLVGKEPDLEVWRILCTNFLKGRDDSYDYKTLPISEKEN